MNKIAITIIFSLGLLALSGPVCAHELVDANGRPVPGHQHVWRQQSYGQDYRQGHSVNNAQGSIIIWSPNTYQGYKAGSNVRFARPTPITSAPKTGANIPELNRGSRTVNSRGKD